jgi:hypothetical protein
MSSVAEFVIRRFTTLYGPPSSHDQDAFEEEYHKALNGTDPQVLEEAIDTVVKRQTIPAWPVVGACVEAVNEVAERQAAARRRQVAPQQEEYRRPTPEERARVQALVNRVKSKLAGKVA